MIKQHDPLVIAVSNLVITEAGNGYYITYYPQTRRAGLAVFPKKSGITRGMGDGVDWYSDDLVPGTVEFNEMLNADLEEDYETFLEAYFPDVEEQE